MAVMAAMGCSRAAMPFATSAAALAPSSSITSEASLGLPLRRCTLGLGLQTTTLPGIRPTNFGRTLSRLQVHAESKLGGVGNGQGSGLVQAEEAKEVEIVEESNGFFEKAFLSAAIALLPLVDVETASAAGGEFGLLEGRSAALIHPIAMGGLFAYTIYAGYLGWQWRRVRTIQNEINDLKKQVKQVPVAAGEASAPPPPPSPVEGQIAALTEERKVLVKGGFRDKHFNAGSILLGFGVLEAVIGPLNTWARTGKLFPGPHLFAGAGITVLWALAAALVPEMQKGNESARNAHIALNVLNVLLFIWQIPTGWEIVEKVFQFTTWP